MRRVAAALLIAAFAGVLTPAEAATIEVTIAKMAYAPAEITVKTGDIIKWINNDFVIHTVTARDKSFDVVIAAHGSNTQTVTGAGTIDFFCRFHPMMKGKIRMEDN